MATAPQPTDDTQAELQKVLNEIQLVEEELPEAWNLDKSITELEETVDAYNRIEP